MTPRVGSARPEALETRERARAPEGEKKGRKGDVGFEPGSQAVHQVDGRRRAGEERAEERLLVDGVLGRTSERRDGEEGRAGEEAKGGRDGRRPARAQALCRPRLPVGAIAPRAKGARVQGPRRATARRLQDYSLSPHSGQSAVVEHADKTNGRRVRDREVEMIQPCQKCGNL